jgi:hypothetical protein
MRECAARLKGAPPGEAITTVVSSVQKSADVWATVIFASPDCRRRTSHGLAMQHLPAYLETPCNIAGRDPSSRMK